MLLSSPLWSYARYAILPITKTFPTFYPWRCLCRGLLLQIMYTLPFRLTLRQFRHIFFAADRTFIPLTWVVTVDEDGRRENNDEVGFIVWRGRKIGRGWRNGRIRAKNILVSVSLKQWATGIEWRMNTTKIDCRRDDEGAVDGGNLEGKFGDPRSIYAG